MSKTVRIAANVTVAKLVDDDPKVNALVNEALSYRVEGAEYMHSFKTGSMSGISSFFTFTTRSFPAGFVGSIESVLKKAGYHVQLVRRQHYTPLGDESPIVDEFGNDDPRYDYQMQALRQVEKHGRGIIRVATGGGKSKIAKLIMARYRRPTLFLTTRGVLLYQMKDACEAQGMKVGIVGDGEWSPIRGVNVGMVQTLVAKLEEPDLNAEIRALIKSDYKKMGLTREQMKKLGAERYAKKVAIRNKTIKLLEMFEVVIGEEAHEASGNSYYTILKHCKNAQIRVALTATPFMKDSHEDNLKLMAGFGQILINVSEDMLIKRGILAKPYFKFHRSSPHPKVKRTTPWQRAYELGIVEAPCRNADIVEYARKAVKHGLPVMILVQRKRHGDMLRALLERHGIAVEFIQGEDDQPERKRALKRLADGKCQVLIGTTILDVGVDVPAVGMVILAGGGKAQVALRQRIGRGLRAKKTGPNVAFIVDFADDVNSHLRDHYRQRREIIESTPGFAEGVLGDEADFPWELFEPAGVEASICS